MSFHDEAPGTVLVQWEDGSAIVGGDGTDREYQALLGLLEGQGSGREEAEAIARTLREQGLTLSRRAESADPRAMGGKTFEAIGARFEGVN
jgi:hypothetical protein